MVIHRTKIRHPSKSRLRKPAIVLLFFCTVFLSGWIGFDGRFSEGWRLVILIFPAMCTLGCIVLLSQELGAKAMGYLSCAIVIGVICGIWLAAFWGIQIPST